MHILIIINVDSLRQNKNKHYYIDKYKQNMGSFTNHVASCQARLHLENIEAKNALVLICHWNWALYGGQVEGLFHNINIKHI